MPLPSRAVRSGLALAVLLALLLAVGVILKRRGEGAAAPEGAGPARAAAATAPVENPATGTKEDSPAVASPATARKARIAGCVLRADGSPARGWRVMLFGHAEDTKKILCRDLRADGEGGFTIEDVEEDVYELQAATSLHSTNPKWGGRIAAGQQVEGIVLRLPPLFDFAVTVVDGRGAAVEGAQVAIAGGGGLPEVRTGLDGRAAFERCDLDPAPVCVTPPPGLRRFLAAVAWSRSAARELRVVLEDAGVASGTAFAPDGSPAAGVRIVTKRGPEILAETVSGPDGRFESCVPRDGAANLVAESEHAIAWLTLDGGRKMRVRGSISRASPGDHDLRIELEEVTSGLRLEVVVTSPEEKPVEGARVYVYEQRAGTTREAVTDLNGRAVVEGLDDVEYCVSAVPPADAKDAWLPEFTFAVYPGQEPCEIQFAKGLRLKGVVLRPDGSPAAGASLTSDLGGLSVQPYTNSGIPVDPDGRFSILVRAAQAEHLTLHASADAGALAADVEIDARDVKEEVVIRLAKLK